MDFNEYVAEHLVRDRLREAREEAARWRLAQRTERPRFTRFLAGLRRIAALFFALAVIVACRAEARVVMWKGTGERVRHIVAEVPDLQARQVELSEFVLRRSEGPDARASELHVVLVADLAEWFGNVFGYAEQPSRLGGRHLYRIYGAAHRDPTEATVYDLAAVYTASEGKAAMNRASDFAFRIAFRMRVDRGGVAEVVPRPWVTREGQRC